MASAAPESTATSLQLALLSLWQRLQAVFPKIRVSHRRSLRLCESLSLGEKRIVAVIECDDQRYLLAATSQSVSLLQTLAPKKSKEKSDGQS